jgi:hypothetical protein
MGITGTQEQDSTTASAQAQSRQSAARAVRRGAHVAGMLCARSRAHSRGHLQYQDSKNCTGRGPGNWQSAVRALSRVAHQHTASAPCARPRAHSRGHLQHQDSKNCIGPRTGRALLGHSAGVCVCAQHASSVHAPGRTTGTTCSLWGLQSHCSSAQHHKSAS